VVALASRGKLANARKYCELCKKGSPTPYDDYDKLLGHKGMDAVYFSLPTALRTKWVLKAIEKGLHVLVEKPMNGLKEVQAMVKAAEAKGVQFMDGVMMMHNPRLKAIIPTEKEKKEDGKGVLGQTGPLRAVVSSFATGPMDRGNIRYNAGLEPYGALGDLGWYNIRITLWAFGYDLPVEVRAESNRLASANWHEGMIENVQVTMFYEDGRIGRFDAEFNNSCMRQWARLVGEKEEVHIPNFVISKTSDSFSIIKGKWGDFDAGQFNVQDAESVVPVGPSVQEAECIRNFATCIEAQKPDPFWPTIVLKTQAVLDACYESFRAGGKRIKVTKHIEE